MWTQIREAGAWYEGAWARRFRVTVDATWSGLTWELPSFSFAGDFELDLLSADPGPNLWQFQDLAGTNFAYVIAATTATGVALSPGTYWVNVARWDDADRAWEPDLNNFTLSGSPVAPFTEIIEETVVGGRPSGIVRAIIYKSSTAEPLAELPLNDLTWTRTLSGCGSLSGTLPIWHPLATEDILGQHHGDPDREIAVFVDGQCDWNGPLTATSCTLSGDTIQLNVREASWYLLKRTLEEDKDYTGDDVFDAVRNLVSYMKNKTASGDDGMTLGDDIVADIPRFDVTAGMAGATLGTVTFAGSARHTLQECFDFLAADPETGFEWRMDYKTSSTRQSPHRTLTLGYPGVGTTLDGYLTQSVLTDYGRDLDWERSATRVHVMYGGGVVTRQSAAAVGNGVILLEDVDDYTDTSNEDFATARAKDLKRRKKPAIRVPSASFRHGGTLAHDFIDLGDVMPFEITWPDILSITADTRRVIEITKRVNEGALDVDLTFNDRLTDLGDV